MNLYYLCDERNNNASYYMKHMNNRIWELPIGSVMDGLIHEEVGRKEDHVRFRIRDQHLSHWRILGNLPTLALQTRETRSAEGQACTRTHSPLRVQDSSSAPAFHSGSLPLPLLLTTSHNLCGHIGHTQQGLPALQGSKGSARFYWWVCLSTGRGQIPSITLRHTVKFNWKKETTEYQGFHMIALNSSQNAVPGPMEVPMAILVGL